VPSDAAMRKSQGQVRLMAVVRRALLSKNPWLIEVKISVTDGCVLNKYLIILIVFDHQPYILL
jgi:hypothetical protein